MLKKMGLLGLVMVVSLVLFPATAGTLEPTVIRYYGNSSKTIVVGQRSTGCYSWGVTSVYARRVTCPEP